MESQDEVKDIEFYKKEGSTYNPLMPRFESLSTNDSSFKNNLVNAKVTFMSKNIENIKD